MRPPRQLLTLILAFACLLSGAPLAAHAHDDPAPVIPAPAVPSSNTLAGHDGGASTHEGDPDDGEEPQTTPSLFLPLLGRQPGDGEGMGEQPPQEGEPPQTGDGHHHDDYYLAEQARLRNEPPFVAPLLDVAAPGDLNLEGQWGPVFTWPFVFATAANLPDGRIIAWGGNNLRSFNGGTNTYASIWDPSTGTLLSRNHSDHSMFCAIPTMLEDGRVFVNGGDGTRERTSIFDYRTNAWTRVQNMNVGRWYNGAVALPNGQVFTALGDPGSRYPELWTANTGWSYLTGADLQAPILNFSGYQNNWLPYLFLNSDGRIFHSGPTRQMNWITPGGNGSIATANLNNDWYPKYSTSVMYDENKILVAGGQISGTNQAATNQAMVIDLSGPAPTKTAVVPMANARKFNNGVVLPTGEVLIVGGNTSGTEFSDAGTILTPEIWNPSTLTWRTVAPHSVPRNYHSVALLMTDGRVFSGGGGLCNCAADHPDHQVYSPPYLFNADGSLATRPQISSAPNTVSYGRTVDVSATPGVQKWSLIKMSGTTHNLNSDLRFLSVPFSEVSSGQYRLTLHANRNVLTPGNWMLFAVNAQGVPSVAKVLLVSSTDAPSVANPGAQSTPQGSAVSLQITASDPTGDPITFSATGLPQGLSIHPTSGLISGTANTPGAYNTTVSVSDEANITSVSFAWSVMAPGLVRYVKLEALSEVAGNAWTSVAEFNLLDANGVTIGRNGWSVSADSEEIQGENGRAANAIDGSTSTIWHTQWQAASPTHPHWLQVNLGGSWSVGAFRYLPRQDMANGRIAAYRFFVSADGTNWGAAVAAGTFANDALEKTVSVPQTAPPNITAPAPQVSVRGSSVNLPITAGDPDPQDTIFFSAGGLPPGVAIDGTSGVIAGLIPNTAAVGSYTTTVTARDSRGFSSSVSFNWTVQALPFTVGPIVSPPKPINTPVSYSAVAANAVNPRYKWLFGDGTPETPYSPEATASHSFSQPGLYVVRVTVTDDRGGEQSTTFIQAVHLPLTGGKPSASSAVAYEQRSGGDRVWVVNPDNDSVSVFDSAGGGRLAEIPVGAAPRSLALGPNGQVWVSNKGGATISVVDGSSLTVARTIPLPPGSQPFGIVFAPAGAAGGAAAYVALEGGGQVLQIDPSSGAVVRSAVVGANPRHLSISADGSRLLVARFITPPLPGEATAVIQPGGGGEVIALDTSSLSVVRTVILQLSGKNDTEVQGRGVPNYLGAPVISPDGIAAWVPSKQDNVLRGTLRDGSNLNFQNTVRAITSRIDLSTLGEDYAARLDLDNSGMASAAAFDPYGVYLFVALETSREVAVVDIHGRRELFRIPVGRAPQGLAVSPDGQRLYVQNFMDRTLGVFDVASLVNAGSQAAPAVATVPSVGSERLGPQVLLGKQLFYDAKDPRLAQDAYISCAACHNDGGQDGRVWDLTGFGEGLRNTIDLQGHGGMAQGPLHWSANFDEVQDFEGQIRALSGGLGLMSDPDFGAAQAPLGSPKAGKSADLDALAAYVASLSSFAASPYRNGDGTLTADGAAGRSVFLANGCGRCHTGAAFSNSAPNNLQNVGTLKPSSGSRLGGPLAGLDTPSLRSIWQTGPYLHDGSAASLPDAVRAHSGVALAEGDLSVLVAYLQQIDGSEPAPPNQLPGVNLTSPANGAVFNLGTAINLSAAAADVDGVVTKVEFYAGATLLNSDASAPYSFAWTPAGLGAYSITARAYDDRGAVTTSAAANITVNSGVATGGLLGSYYGNVSLSGAPLLQRVETVNFNWGNAAPGAGVPSDLYSVRWVGRVQASANGTYYFRTVSDDGVRLWVNGVQRINNWTDHGATTNTSAAITLLGGQWYNVTLEYYERRGKAVMQFQWRTPGTTTYGAIPPAQLSPQ